MAHRDKRTRRHRDGAEAEPAKQTVDDGVQHQVAETDRPETPALEGGPPLPEELTGRASGTNEDLTALFNNDSTEHLADGFRGGSDDDPSELLQPDGTSDPESASE